jgi:archaellum component FlaC
VKFDDLKKQKRVTETEKIKEIQQLQQRNNQLQTDFENAKVMTA